MSNQPLPTLHQPQYSPLTLRSDSGGSSSGSSSGSGSRVPIPHAACRVITDQLIRTKELLNNADHFPLLHILNVYDCF